MGSDFSGHEILGESSRRFKTNLVRLQTLQYKANPKSQDDGQALFFCEVRGRQARIRNARVVVRPECYETLASIPHWRRIFSSLWTSDDHPLFLWGRTFRSHSHAFQSAKFQAAGRDDIALRFSVESGSALGTTGTGLDAHRARKMAVLSQEQLQRWRDVEDEKKDEIYRAKYAVAGLPREALIATLDAQLWNRGPRISPIRCQRLEALRLQLKVAAS